MDADQTPHGLHLTKSLRRKSHISYSSMSIVFSLGWLCGQDKSVNGVPLFPGFNITITPTTVSAFPTDIRLHLNSDPCAFQWLGDTLIFRRFSPGNMDDDCATARFRVRSNRESIPLDRNYRPWARPNSNSSPTTTFLLDLCLVVDPWWIEQGSTGQLCIISQGRWTVLPYFVCETQLRQVRDSGWRYADNPGAMETRWIVMDEWLHLEINCHGEVNLEPIRKAVDPSSFVCKTTTQSSWWRW